jgi:hypothetical protein
MMAALAKNCPETEKYEAASVEAVSFVLDAPVTQPCGDNRPGLISRATSFDHAPARPQLSIPAPERKANPGT